ncbi:UDP-N-acetylglucosamine 2-epimerase [Halomarina rubra]|uniref:UDP-N-acetylglucosamine 2-epimerase n=1 Tax=Halomarina rubra TaxID=2071873 RepID=A0ABD6AXG6_9EURY
MTDPRHVVVVTGTRAEYGLLSSSMRAIEARDDLRLSIVATGMHLSPQYGHTVDDVRADGFEVAREVPTLVDGDSGAAMAKSLGLGVSGMADALASLDPDVVLLLGDRGEAFAAGVAAAHMNVPLAHVHGGDSMDGAIIDDSIRHALTKFAHLHFPVTDRSADRIRKLGEEPWRIETVGAPGLDAVLAGEYDTPAAVRERLDLPDDGPIALVVQHPLTSAPDLAGEQMAATLDAVAALDVHPLVVYPNSDAGGRRAIAEIERRADLTTVRSLPRETYLGVMAAADVMVGNSSSGVIEAPSFDLPVVDVGPRQEGRERADHTLQVPHDRDAIREAVERCLTDEAFRQRVASCENPYDRGGAGERVAARLATVDLGEGLLRKRLTY